MTGEAYDAVIVGGRCAGAALATFLARDGASVALLDADAAGSDQLISTHTVHPSGMDVLDELGVAEAVRALAPPPRQQSASRSTALTWTWSCRPDASSAALAATGWTVWSRKRRSTRAPSFSTVPGSRRSWSMRAG